MSKVHVRRLNRQAALAAGLVTLLVGATLASAPAAVAANQNEVVMRLNYDGTSSVAADAAFPDATPTTYTSADTGAHTPGLDHSLQNRVVRTYDQYGYVIDYDVNEAAGTDLMLTVTLTNGTGTTLADPTGTNPNPSSNVRWIQDPDMASRGWFTGCLPNTTNDPNGTRIVGATLYCKLGNLPEGTHGTIRPTVSLANGIDATAIGAKVTLTSTSSTQTPTPSSVAPNVFVSGSVQGNWIKNNPIVVPAKAGGTSTGADGYIALFPLGMTDASQLSSPARGSVRIPAPNPGEQIDFYDHFYNIAGITSNVSANVRPATQAEMDSTHANPVGQRVWGDWCGAYDSQNGGGLPGNLQGNWTCTYQLLYPNNYPVKGLGVNSYSNTAVATNADGTPNGQGYIVTGQLAFWISKSAIEAVNGTTATAQFGNAISNVAGGTDNFQNATTTIKPIEVVPAPHTPYGGTSEIDLTPAAASDTPVVAAGKSRADNRSPFGIVPPTSGGGGGGTGVSYTSHFGVIASGYGTQQHVAVNSSGTKWDPATPSCTSPTGCERLR